MGQLGFWDREKREQKLDEKKALLQRLNEVIPWQEFPPLLERVNQRDTTSRAGRKPTDVILMFKLLVLQHLFNLSDDELEYQANDRLSFMKFLGLGIEDRIPDAKTVWLFRQQLTEQGSIEELFEQFDSYLRQQGYEAKQGQIVDTSLVPVPKQRTGARTNSCVMERYLSMGPSIPDATHRRTPRRVGPSRMGRVTSDTNITST